MLTDTEWRKVFAYCAAEIGWTPNQTASLTVAQLDGIVFSSDSLPREFSVKRWQEEWNKRYGIQAG